MGRNRGGARSRPSSTGSLPSLAGATESFALLPSLTAVILALVMVGCGGVSSQTRVVTSGGAGSGDVFPQIRVRADRVVKGQEGDVALRVHFAAGEEAMAERVLEQLRKPVRFLEDRTGLRVSGRAFGFDAIVRIYLAPLPADGLIPHHLARGRDFLVAVLFYAPGGDLEEAGYNQFILVHVLPHELSHLGLLEQIELGDRWLHDGIPEYLAGEFTKSRSPELYRSLRVMDPPAVALDRTRLEPWPAHSNDGEEHDPEYFALQKELGARKYRAAEELVRRWLAAARANGVDDPLRDLIGRLQDLGQPLGFERMKELALEQSGQTLGEIATVPPEEKERARREAWSDRTAEERVRRLWALQILRQWGLPRSGDPRGLLDSLEAADGTGALTDDDRWIRAAAGAIATAGDPAVARRLVERVPEAGRDLSLPPELWELYAQVDREEALRRLVETMQADAEPLLRKIKANGILEDLTGRSAGWAADLPPGEREEAAGRWRELISQAPWTPRPTRATTSSGASSSSPDEEPTSS